MAILIESGFYHWLRAEREMLGAATRPTFGLLWSVPLVVRRVRR